jgi:hypothetical protein
MKIKSIKQLLENVPNEAQLSVNEKSFRDASVHYSQATIELVDNHAGVYAPDTLVATNSLFNIGGKMIESDKLKNDLHPDNEDYCENICYWFDQIGLYVKDVYGTMWKCDFWEGDII